MKIHSCTLVFPPPRKRPDGTMEWHPKAQRFAAFSVIYVLPKGHPALIGGRRAFVTHFSQS